MATLLGPQGKLNAKPEDTVVFRPSLTFPIAKDGSHTTYLKKDVEETLDRALAVRLEAAKKGKILGRPHEVAAAKKKAADDDNDEGAEAAQLTPEQLKLKGAHIKRAQSDLVTLASKAALGTKAELSKLTKDQLADLLARAGK